MMQGCGNEIFSIFNRFRRLKISSILPGVSSVEMGTLKTIEHCRKKKRDGYQSCRCQRVRDQSGRCKGYGIGSGTSYACGSTGGVPDTSFPGREKIMSNVWCVRVTGGMFM